MFNIQEIEEREYFPQTEQQNVYQQSQMEAARRPNGKAAIKAMTDQGKWVLAYWMARLCPHTDALLGGADYSVAHVFDDGDAYKAFCDSKGDDFFSGDSDCGFELFKPATATETAPEAPPVEYSDDDIPF